MNLRDVVREKTLAARDSLAAVNRRREALIGEQHAEQERIKRLFTDLSGHRRNEQSLKRRLSEAETEIASVRAEIDELERQRSLLFERYTALTESRSGVEDESKAVQHEEKLVGETVKASQDRLRSLEQETTKLEREHTDHQAVLRRAYTDSFVEYSAALSKLLEGAMGSQADRERRLAERKRFLSARHDLPEVGQLCDERDELRAILDSSRVPAVKELLSARLKVIEFRLEELFPGALAADMESTSSGSISEIFYLREADDSFVLMLPFDEKTWNEMSADESGRRAGDVAAAAIFGITRGFGLKPADGEFCLYGGRIAYVGHFDDSEVAVMASSPISLPGLTDVYLSLSRMPSEIEEALRGDEIRS